MYNSFARNLFKLQEYLLPSNMDKIKKFIINQYIIIIAINRIFSVLRLDYGIIPLDEEFVQRCERKNVVIAVWL